MRKINREGSLKQNDEADTVSSYLALVVTISPLVTTPDPRPGETTLERSREVIKIHSKQVEKL